MQATVKSRLPEPQLLILFFFSAAVFSLSLLNGFALDDLIHVSENEGIKNLSQWKEILVSPSFPGNLYRPVTNLTYALTHHFVGAAPLLYHAENILLHAAVTCALLLLLLDLGLTSLALPTALIFTVHPLHVEAVANVVGRAELLAAFFGIQSIRAYLTAVCSPQPDIRSSIYSVVWLLLALMSKESAFVVPLLMLLVGAFRSIPLRRQFPALLLSAFAVTAFYFWRVQVLGGIHLGTGDIELLDNPLLGVNAGARAIIALALLGRYLSLSFFPFPLSADYSYAVIDPANFWVNPENLLGLVIVFCIAAAGFANRKQNSALWFFTCWFFLSFAVTANLLFPIGTVFAERLAYLPSVGTAGILALLIMRLPLPSLRFGGLTLLLGAYALMSWQHIPVWKDNTSLHTYQIGVSSQSAKTLHNYAVVLRNRGKLDEALFMFHQALDRYSHFADAAFGLGSVYLLKGIFGGAEHWFNEALKIDPQHQASLTFLARIYRLQGHKTEAENLEKRIADKANKK